MRVRTVHAQIFGVGSLKCKLLVAAATAVAAVAAVAAAGAVAVASDVVAPADVAPAPVDTVAAVVAKWQHVPPN